MIDAILEDDKQRPAKQRHTAKRIFDRLKEEHQFTGGYTIVKDYVRGEQVRSREVFVPLTRLMESFHLLEVTHAVEHALQLGTISFDAVRHLLLCNIERRPPRLDMANYPHLPLAQVRTTQAADYMTLLVEVAVEVCA